MNNINELNIPIRIIRSIAVNKSMDLATPQKNSHRVQVVMTKSAKIFTRNCATA